MYISTILTDHASGKLICFPCCSRILASEKASQIRPLQDNLNVNVDLSSRLLFPSRNQMQIACLHLWNILESFNFAEVYFASERPIRKKLLPCLKLVRLAWSGR